MKKFFILFSLFAAFTFCFAAYAIHEPNHNYFTTIGRNDPVTFDTGFEAYAVLTNEFIGQGGKCTATLFEKNVSEDILTGPTEDGVCKYFLSGSEFELFGITKEHIGKNISFSFMYFPKDCESSKCADKIESDFPLGVVSSGTDVPPPPPTECEDEVSILDIEVEPNPILDCEKFITKPILSYGLPCGFCEVRINGEAPRGGSYFKSPGDLPGGGCSGVEILPEEFGRFGINGGGTAQIVWRYFPTGCGSEACAQVLEKEFNVDPCEESVPSGELTSLVEELDFIREDLISEYEDTRIRPIKVVANKINRVANLLEEASLASEEGDPDTCDELVSQSVRSLDSALTLFESRQCKFRSSRRCIPRDIVDTYQEDLEAIFDDLDEISSTDEDEDGLSDACGFF